MYQPRRETDKEINPEFSTLIFEILQALYDIEDRLYHGNWTPPIVARTVRNYLFDFLPESTREEIEDYVRRDKEDDPPGLKKINDEIDLARTKHELISSKISTALMIRDYLRKMLDTHTIIEGCEEVSPDEH